MLRKKESSSHIKIHSISNKEKRPWFKPQSFSFHERRRRDLNPRAAINDLLPFQGSPFGQLGYFSLCRGSSKKSVDSICVSSAYILCQIKIKKRRGWDSNPRALADKRFSRPPRYDHFDTSPYVVRCRCKRRIPCDSIRACGASMKFLSLMYSIIIIYTLSTLKKLKTYYMHGGIMLKISCNRATPHFILYRCAIGQH